ncbi:hypothetical protein SDC9_88645 [bioreactor metagenome]|uniref:Uncharacterized protein n=1 Tax=bioreactor metagenome TaxID=1076179 RepID=A0A644ZTL1_9ZZZZ
MDDAVFAGHPLRACGRNRTRRRGAGYVRRLFVRFLKPVCCVGGCDGCCRTFCRDAEGDPAHLAGCINQSIVRVEYDRDAERASELNRGVGCLRAGIRRCFARGHRFPFGRELNLLRTVHIGRHGKDELAVFVRIYDYGRFA